jgi:hypothetical protein
MQLAARGARGAQAGRGRGAPGGGAPLPSVRGASPGCPHARLPLSRAPAGVLAHRGRGASRPRSVESAAAGDDAERPAAGVQDALSLDDTASLLSSVESDLQRFRAFEAQNEAGITALASISAPSSLAVAVAALGGSLSVTGGGPKLSAEQMARVRKARAGRPAARSERPDAVCMDSARPQRAL